MHQTYVLNYLRTVEHHEIEAIVSQIKACADQDAKAMFKLAKQIAERNKTRKGDRLKAAHRLAIELGKVMLKIEVAALQAQKGRSARPFS